MQRLVSRRGLEYELRLSITLPITTVELSGIHAYLGICILVGKQEQAVATYT